MHSVMEISRKPANDLIYFGFCSPLLFRFVYKGFVDFRERHIEYICSWHRVALQKDNMIANIDL